MSTNRTKDDRAYEAPVLRPLGSLHSLTLLQDKRYGETDGFTFMGQAITNASP